MHRRKSLEEILSGITALQVIKQAAHRNTRSGKNQLATENLRVV